jgi:anti-sigma factor RsiW
MTDESDRQLSQLIREHATRFRASPALESTVRTEITLQSAAARPTTTENSRWRWPAWAFVGVGFACGLVISTAIVLFSGWHAGSGGLEAELVGNHVRALMASHLTDVASTDQHTVKPWFQGKLNYSPPVRDLAQDGFPLVGGRLDYVSGRPVAALVYRRRGHMINLFVWPDAGTRSPDAAARQGYNLVRWNSGGMAFSAISDLDINELRAFAELMH